MPTLASLPSRGVRVALVSLCLAAGLGACKRNTEQGAQPDAMTPGDPASAPTVPNGASGPQGSGGTP